MPEMIVTGELIQMNSHMEFTATASVLMIMGAIVVLVFGVAAVAGYSDCGWKFSAVMFAFAVAGIVMILVGTNKPKEQVINACANGPISLEQVAVKYDIISIDGREVKLRVR